MAAPSVGRRSCVGQRKAAALIYQSRRWIYGRVKVLLYDGFFSLPSSGRCWLYHYLFLIVFLDIKIKTENNPQKNKLIRLIMISPKVAE